MTTTTDPIIQPAETTEFQSAQIAPIVAAHLVHDIYTSAIAPLLPVLIEKMSLTLTQAGLLTTFIQFPGVLNPFIGYLADKVSLRYFVILAPAVTATLIGMIGFAPNYFALAILLFGAGVSTACFHATAPAMIGRVSGRKIGLGMSLFMAAGEGAYAIGPLLAVWVVSTWTLEGFWRITVLGWATSLLLFMRMRGVSARVEKPGSMHDLLPVLPSLYLPLAIFNLLRFPLSESLTTYLPTLMIARGTSLFVAGASLSILMASGVVGVMLIGPASDRIGRRIVLFIITVVSAGLAILFIQVSGWMALLVLLALGFFALSTNAVMMAMVQERFPNNRAMANGLYMMLNFVLRPVGTVAVGFMGDHFGLEKALLWGALLSLLGILPILKLPK